MNTSAEKSVLKIFEKCAGKSGCEVCRPHMADDCLFFPELFRLQDQTEDSGLPLSTSSLCQLLDLCTMCGLCPCQDIKMLILQAKAAFVNEKGISFSGKITSGVEMAGRWGSKFATVVNTLSRQTTVSALVKKTIKIHPERDLPIFPRENFFLWVEKKGLTSRKCNTNTGALKVAYFTGCSAGYLFPEVGKAAVNILKQNNIEVFIPPQECCAMPLIMEGARKAALKKIHFNIESLLLAVENGYDIVFSCPTCGYFFKKMLLENAYYSDAYQAISGAGPDVMKVPNGSKKNRFCLLPKNIYQKILIDDGYFSSLDPVKRIELSHKVKDMGQFLLSIQAKGKLEINPKFPDTPMVYYAPCHQREQDIDQPYYKLLTSFDGSDVIKIGGAMDCCCMGGHLGCKTSFHSKSLQIGQPLFKKLLAVKNKILVTDCLSCRVQFQHALSMYVFHPLELL